MKIKLKNNKGMAAADALVAILIITLFSGLIASISYNIYLANSSMKRISIANGFFVDVFEYVDKTSYSSVTTSNLISYFNEKYYDDKPNPQAKANDNGANTPFKVTIDVINYNETEGNEEKLDLVKSIEMTVEYKLGNKDQRIQMTKIKSREDISNLEDL